MLFEFNNKLKNVKIYSDNILIISNGNNIR